MEQDTAEREPLGHAARVRRDSLVTHLPEPESLEQHPDSLAALLDAIQPPVQLEILESRQLPVDERLVTEIADLRTSGVHVQLALARQREACADAKQRRLA